MAEGVREASVKTILGYLAVECATGVKLVRNSMKETVTLKLSEEQAKDLMMLVNAELRLAMGTHRRIRLEDIWRKLKPYLESRFPAKVDEAEDGKRKD